MTQTSTNTTYNPIPTRISSTHYQLPSRTREDKKHNVKLVSIKGRKIWLCDCEDAHFNKNLDCDHRIYLIEWIQAEKAKREQENQEPINFASALSRIANLEHAQDRTDGTLENLDNALCKKEDQLGILQGRLTGREYQIDKQQKQVDLQRELIGNLQSSVCKLNERTINQDTQIAELIELVKQQAETIKNLKTDLQDYIEMTEEQRLEIIEQRRMIDDQAQLIDALHDQISQQKPSEQVVRIVVDQKAPRQSKSEAPAEKPAAKRGRKVNPNKVEAIKVDGVFTKCLVGGEFEVGIDNFNPVSCTCERHQKEGVYCVHMQRVDSEFA